MKPTLKLSELNARYERLTYQERLKMVFEEFDERKILVTTSFGASSITLLHLIHKVRPRHPIYLINTGYLFEETHRYKDYLIGEMDLNVVEVIPNERSHAFTKKHKVWEGNPDFCCFINKVEPLRPLRKEHDLWITGLLKFQNENRSRKTLFEQQEQLLKFHPILDMPPEELDLYKTIYDLPVHPLANKGFGSLGCVQCTREGNGREGRWIGTAKTECGLHLGR